ncbi:hypothetical protein KPL39_08060 [Clostridium gasigenes]|uniref:hypothetical protein n=1 Tax=Clostridium gasigenes TaxID=94869 RepID=UPI0014383A55|nr:hypothetical protein [Clostridium gasigenes]MBU3136224.1 hypothetical protein [Clostridium gasigenes]NKF07137.1 hypothetical protein [Clostridium gasigenes]QSW18120.1 hypothetical protein J1C67_11130 [Clostridium gasigenes]
MKKLLSLVMCILIIGAVSCSRSKELLKKKVSTEVTKEIGDFIEFMNYGYFDESEFVEKYTLTDRKLKDLPYSQIWDLQRASANDFMNEDIEVYKILVKNHRLSNLPGNKLNETEVFIMISDGHIMGGYSIPKLDTVGSVYSIDGWDNDELTNELKANPVVETKSTDKKIIATEVYTGYIKANSTDWRNVERNKLDREPIQTVLDYKITSINMTNEFDDFFTVSIGYDIKSVKESSQWVAGNGEDGPDNWIINKSGFADIMKVGKNKYIKIKGYTG